LNEISDCVRTA